MPETHSPEPCRSEEGPNPAPAPVTRWTLQARHRHPLVVLLIVLFIVLQLVLAGITVVQGWRLVNLEERIELLEKGQAQEPE